MNCNDSLVRRRQVDLAVAVCRWPSQIVNNDYDSRHVRHWRAWCERRGVPFIDLPAFLSADGADDSEHVVRQYFVDSDVHWNDAGRRLVAETFLAHYGTPAGAAGGESPLP